MEKRSATIMNDYEEVKHKKREKVVRTAMSGYRNQSDIMNTPNKSTFSKLSTVNEKKLGYKSPSEFKVYGLRKTSIGSERS
jgi:hypothetical protein